VILAGVAGLVVTFVCAVGFVASTVRADARVHALEPGDTARLEGAVRRWALAATLVGIGSVLLLAGGVFGG
jgi:hypothetical protein